MPQKAKAPLQLALTEAEKQIEEEFWHDPYNYRARRYNSGTKEWEKYSTTASPYDPNTCYTDNIGLVDIFTAEQADIVQRIQVPRDVFLRNDLTDLQRYIRESLGLSG